MLPGQVNEKSRASERKSLVERRESASERSNARRSSNGKKPLARTSIRGRGGVRPYGQGPGRGRPSFNRVISKPVRADPKHNPDARKKKIKVKMDRCFYFKIVYAVFLITLVSCGVFLGLPFAKQQVVASLIAINKSLATPCIPKNPCANENAKGVLEIGGECEVNVTTDTYSCKCYTGYSGVDCKISPCSDQLCNAYGEGAYGSFGECKVVHDGGYRRQCDCDTDFSGPDCKYSPCNTPMNNTELTLIQKKYTKSKNETEKTSLNQNITVLEADTLNPCTNGTCSIDTSAENRGKIKCSCHAGYSGITCGTVDSV